MSTSIGEGTGRKTNQQCKSTADWLFGNQIDEFLTVDATSFEAGGDLQKPN